VRFLTHRTDPNTIVTWHFILLTPLTLIPAVFVWQWPEPYTYIWLAALAGLGTVGHLALTRAYSIAQASQLAPLDFTQLLAVAAIGFAAFGEMPDVWT
jgi:drug/metabolite transporter (DMT)-like permease